MYISSYIHKCVDFISLHAGRDRYDWATASDKVFKSDQDVLIHGKELTDALIDAAQNLLRKNYPRINGLQPPSLAPLLQFNPTPTRAVQIHHTGKSA